MSNIDWSQLITAEDKAAQELANLHAYAARKRYEIETGGITVAGTSIDTSRESQAMITGSYAFSQANPSEIIKFKAKTGWIAIDSATMGMIANAVGAHVQECFATEETISQMIDDGLITATQEIDEYPWPGQE